MRRVIWFVTILAASACGDDGGAPTDGAIDHDAPIDSPQMQCENQGAIGQFIRRANNPRVLPGTSFTDGKLDTFIADPDVRWDSATSKWEAYWGASHASSYGAIDFVQLIRHATSPDRITWTIDDAPALSASTDVNAWDRADVASPTVIFNPAASPDRRYLMLYSGASGPFDSPTSIPANSHMGANFQIGAAFSADGRTFTRISAGESPHGLEGLVLTPAQVFPTGSKGVVSDPEVVLAGSTYHLFFSSLSCTGSACTTNTFGVSHATSTDGIHWVVEAAPVRSLLRTSSLLSGGTQPSVVYDQVHCKWEMWIKNDASDTDVMNQPVAVHNMAGVYKAESSDGLSWTVNYAFNRDFSWTQAEDGEGLGLWPGVDVAANGNGRLMLYVGFDDQNVPSGFTLPRRAPLTGMTPGVHTLNVATRDLP